MLSYRHAFHAGNHADVLKHIVLMEVLSYMTKKDKSLTYIDTHAGAGGYTLSEGFAAQNKEWLSGIDRLCRAADAKTPPPAVSRYLDLIAEYRAVFGNDDYPGSPMVAARLLRDTDTGILCELHPRDAELLQARCSSHQGLRVYREDGYAKLKASLPPPSRRALVFIDPSYELHDEYARLVEAMKESMRRFPGGVYLIWYPLIDNSEAMNLPDRLRSTLPSASPTEASERPPAPARSLHAALRIRQANQSGFGMTGSGVIMYNPPWELEATLREVLPYLAGALGTDANSGWTLESGDMGIMRKKP